jgi:DNA modification methylase
MTLNDKFSDIANGLVFLACGDCLEVLAGLPENSIDAVVTDPPYELSNDGKQSAARVFFEVAFPQHSYVDSVFTGCNELSLLVSKVLGLDSIGSVPKPAPAMPVVAVAFNGDTSGRYENIEDVRERPVGVSESEACYDFEAHDVEHLGCFALKVGDVKPILNFLNGAGSSFFSGGIGIGFGITPSSLPSLLHGCGPIIFGDDDIGLGDNALSELVGAFRGAENCPVLRFDLGRASEERLSADGARLLCALLVQCGAKLVRANATARRLPPMLQARRISVINDAANGAFSFDLICHPHNIASTGFMGKSWDGSKVAFDAALWAEVLRVLKPGGHMVAFGAPKNYHRLACAVEDAGFEVRDCLQWIFGTGFPKSMDVSKAIDKAAGAEREVVGPDPQAAKRNKTTSKFSGCYGEIKDAESCPLTAPATDEAKQWAGWGTALKPAYEPIVLARKPLSEKTVAANVLRWGTGALNIDATRIEASGRPLREVAPMRDGVAYNPNSLAGRVDGSLQSSKAVGTTDLGRWPATICHDGSQQVLDLFPQSKSTGGQASLGAFRNGDVYGKGRDEKEKRDPGYGDEGSAARFFYSAKASKADRAGSRHPTVKPVSLMQWLVRMVTPPGGTVLDPFAGSGTTGMASAMEGFKSALIEREEEYQNDIRSRFVLFKDALK